MKMAIKEMLLTGISILIPAAAIVVMATAFFKMLEVAFFI